MRAEKKTISSSRGLSRRGLMARRLGVAAILASASGAAAADLYYDGGDLLWDTASSWSTDPANPTPDPGAAPAAGDNVFFNISGSPNISQTVTLGSNRAALSLNFTNLGTTTFVGGGGDRNISLGTNGSVGGLTVGVGAGAVSFGSGASASRATTNFTGGTLNFLNNSSNAVSWAGATMTTSAATTLNFNGGNFTFAPQIDFSTSTSGRAYVNISSGTVSMAFARLGRSATSIVVFDVKGGTLTGNNAFSMANTGGSRAAVYVSGSASFTKDAPGIGVGANSIGLVDLSSGTIDLSNGGARGPQPISMASDAASVGILNVRGGTFIGGTAPGMQLNAGTSIVNLTGGSFTMGRFEILNPLSATVNFNGSSVKAAGPSTTWLPVPVSGTSAVYLHSGGALIDTNNFAITIAQPLRAPTGNGLQSIGVASGGTGYNARPFVDITGGGGTGATAVAEVVGGVVTGIVITNPGIGYTSAPTITLVGGEPTSAATLNVATYGANVSGGLLKSGTGTLTLANVSASTYAGGTTVTGGTLSATKDDALGTGNVTVNNATLLLATGATNDYIDDLATLSIAGTGIANLNFTGTDTVAGLILGGDIKGPGEYSLVLGNGGGFLTGTGSITVVAAPEPATLSLIGLAGFGLMARRRRRTT